MYLCDNIAASAHSDDSTQLDVVLLSVMSNRFMSIAEQMGRTLQRTAISTNIKERLDFSCALFGVRTRTAHAAVFGVSMSHCDSA